MNTNPAPRPNLITRQSPFMILFIAVVTQWICIDIPSRRYLTYSY